VRRELGFIACGAALFACSNLLGIEELDRNPRAGAEGGADGGTSGTSGGSSGGMGGKGGSGGKSSAGAGGTGGTAGVAGSAGRGGSSGGGGRGGTGGVGGSITSGGSGGASGDAGAAGEVSGGTGGGAGTGVLPDRTVRGHVMDFWRMPIANAPIAIGDVTTTTDANGDFVIEAVPSEYDASVIVQTSYSSYGWVYQGLTRRDPTLQVYRGQPDAGGAEFQVTHQNAVFETDSRWLLALGSEGGSLAEDQGTDASRDIWSYWVGPNTISMGVHGLLFRRAADGVPIGYDAYDTVTESVTDEDVRDVMFDFQATALSTGTVSGTVTSPETSQRTNRLFMRFASGAAMPIAAIDEGSDAYSYLLPTLPDASVTIAASYGPVEGPYAIVYRDGAQPGDTGMDLEIPVVPATIVSPNNDATNVTDSTQFLFTKQDSGVGAFLVVIHGRYSAEGTGLYIVTSKSQFTLSEFPVVAGAYSLASDSEYGYWVESHGRPASVDAMAGPEGGLDSFGLTYTAPAGPSRGEGSYTSSNTRGLRTAP
jgi:hypothetical protein